MPKVSRTNRISKSYFYRTVKKEATQMLHQISEHEGVNLLDKNIIHPHPPDHYPTNTADCFVGRSNSHMSSRNEADNSNERLQNDDQFFGLFQNVCADSDYQINPGHGTASCSRNPSCNAESFETKLRNWALSCKVSHSTLNQLLKILSEIPEGKNLPKDARSFLHTPKQTALKVVAPGHYYHVGIQKSLEQQYKNLQILPNHETGVIIAVNIDGLPLTKSTNSQLYPILSVNKSINSRNNVSVIGIYHGNEKPSVFNVFLQDFVEEAVNLTNFGIEILGTTYTFKISMLLFDAVAKASILCIKGHSGYSSCTKCTQEGEYLLDRVCFPNLNFNKRTHQDFINKTDEDHHVGDTILQRIPGINLIEDIPLDYMHLVCLGVVKKLLVGTWCFGSPPHKMCGSNVDTVSAKLESFITFTPSEFARKPRALKEAKRWKATEFRQFLLYTGPLALKNILPKQKYQHFLTLHIAVRILLSPKCCTDNDLLTYADSLLKHFVNTTKVLYGSHFLSHNFHNLLHLVDDVRKFGSLENFSNFSSENFLQVLKALIRKHDKILPQIIRRLEENSFSYYHCEEPSCSNTFRLTQEHNHGILLEGCTPPLFKSVLFKNFKISRSTADACCILKDRTIIEVKNFAYCPAIENYVVIGQAYTERLAFYNTPCDSSLFSIYFVKNLGPLSYWPLSEVDFKFARFPDGDGFVVFPLLHLD